jgi:hypothetical protein
MIDQLPDSGLVHITHGGYSKLIDSIEAAAWNLLNSSGCQQSNANPVKQQGF